MELATPHLFSWNLVILLLCFFPKGLSPRSFQFGRILCDVVGQLLWLRSILWVRRLAQLSLTLGSGFHTAAIKVRARLCSHLTNQREKNLLSGFILVIGKMNFPVAVWVRTWAFHWGKAASRPRPYSCLQFLPYGLLQPHHSHQKAGGDKALTSRVVQSL